MLIAWLVALAWADVVPEAPDDCPPGSHGTTSHWGAECHLDDDDEQCDCDDASCDAVGLCVEVVERGPGGCGLGCRSRVDIVHGECDTDGACATGDCVDRCVPADDTSALWPASVPWVAFGLVVVARRRRMSVA